MTCRNPKCWRTTHLLTFRDDAGTIRIFPVMLVPGSPDCLEDNAYSLREWEGRSETTSWVRERETGVWSHEGFVTPGAKCGELRIETVGVLQ